MRDCLAYFSAWAQRIGMQDIHIDAAGNFHATRTGTGAKRLIVGSHLDTVPNAGAFDGVLGVVLGMMLAETTAPACTLEIVGFSEEEGVRFQRPFIGSTAFVHGLNEQFLSLADSEGITVGEAITAFGLDASAACEPQMQAADAYLEFHIEQGPVLESLGLPIAIVDAIAGQTRATIEFTGHANHAGTTPMNLRHDAFCAAAEWALVAEKTARSEPGLVATVGSVRVSPDAVNIVPGTATLSLDLRHAQDDIRLNAFEKLLKAGRQIAAHRQVAFKATPRVNQKAVPLNTELLSAHANLHRMTSGAGHDAMIVASRIPSAMIFLRSPGGISHHPDENVLPEDVEAALAAGRAFIEKFK
jgi:allantoate deiminase